MSINNIGFLLGTVHFKFRALVNAQLSKELDVTVEMAGILTLLNDAVKLSQAELTEIFQRDKSTIKRLVDHCIKSDLITIDSESTYKKRILCITAKGSAVQTQADIIINRYQEHFFSHMDEQERNTLTTVLQRLISKI
jgi:DNA-binding MarR family transcriptional regulator